jgi:hypothetical protein
MAQAVLLLGKSGSGKSTSLRNLPADKTLIITPNAKELPWRGANASYIEGTNLIRSSDMTQVAGFLKSASDSGKFDYVVVEDTTHYQNKRMLSPQFTASKDWGKWNTFGADVYGMMTKDIETYRDGMVIIFIAHTDQKEDGTMGLRTAGKLLDNSIDIPSYFTYILHSKVVKKDNALEYMLQTNDDGFTLAKTPMGMFANLMIPNDMLDVVQTMKEYKNVGNPATV